MKRIFLLTLIPAITFQITKAQVHYFLQKDSWSMVWNAADDEDGTDPGWYQQYHEMKKNAQGIVPRLPYAAIEYQREHSTGLRTTPLFNIQELGPKNFGGRTRAILLDRDNPDHLFVGGVDGGIWHSLDSGLHWTPVDDQMSTLSTCAITQDFYNHDVIYVGTGEGWGNGDGVIGNGVYRSTDHGVTFSQLPSTDGDAFNWIDRVETSPTDTGMLYIGTANGGLYRSKDFGDTLQKIFATTQAINDIEITPSGCVWIAVHSQGLYFSASGDSGTFVLMNNGLPNVGEFNRIELAIAPSDTTVMYASFENASYNGLKGIYRSGDYGQTWVMKGNPDVDFGFYMSQSWYSMCIAVKPDDPNFVVFGIGDLVYSNDGGVLWHPFLNLHPDHHVLAFNPQKPTRFYLGEDGGFYRFRTDEPYTHWDLNPGYHTIQGYAGCYFPSGINCYEGSQDNGTHYIQNASATAFSIYGGDGAYCAINQQYPNIAYVSTQNGNINRADDADQPAPSFGYTAYELDGNGDGVIDEGAWFINPFDIDMVNGDYLGFVTLKRLWQTTDGGYSWQPAMNPYPNGSVSPYAIGISKTFNPTVYVGGGGAMFIRIDNAFDAAPGNEVNLSGKVPLNITGDFIANITVHPYDSSVAYFALSNFSAEPRVWKVTEGTSANPVFTSISGDLPANLPVNYIDVDPARPDSFFLAGTDAGLYISDDAGNHWQHIDAIPNVFVEQVKVRASDRRVFIFTHGRGNWTGTLDPNIVGIQNVTQNNIAAMVYPNPCNDVLTVNSPSATIAVTIRDVNNRIVLPSKIISGKEMLDVTSLAEGMYLVELKSENQTVVKKIVKAN